MLLSMRGNDALSSDSILHKFILSDCKSLLEEIGRILPLGVWGGS